MDFKKYDSLRSCSVAELYEHLRQAKENVTIYVEKIDPHVYSTLDINLLKNTQIILSKKALMLAPEQFTSFFHDVLFESLQIEIDVKRELKFKYQKFICLIMIIAFSLLFLQPMHSFFLKVTLFTGVILLCFWMYILLNHRALIKVSNIKKHCDFKVMKDGFLDLLPSLYLIDNKMFIGTNLFTSNGYQDFYEVQSDEVENQIRLIYEEYVNSHSSIRDEFLIAQYIDNMHPNDFISFLRQD